MIGLTIAASLSTTNSKPSPDTKVTYVLGVSVVAMIICCGELAVESLMWTKEKGERAWELQKMLTVFFKCVNPKFVHGPALLRFPFETIQRSRLHL